MKIVDDMHQRIVLPPKVKRGVQNAISRLLKPTYFDFVPLKEIFKVIQNEGVDLIDEEGGEWEGMLTGADGRADFGLAYAGKAVRNITLHLTWHRMPSGRMEVVGYIG